MGMTPCRQRLLWCLAVVQLLVVCAVAAQRSPAFEVSTHSELVSAIDRVRGQNATILVTGVISLSGAIEINGESSVRIVGAVRRGEPPEVSCLKTGIAFDISDSVVSLSNLTISGCTTAVKASGPRTELDATRLRITDCNGTALRVTAGAMVRLRSVEVTNSSAEVPNNPVVVAESSAVAVAVAMAKQGGQQTEGAVLAVEDGSLSVEDSSFHGNRGAHLVRVESTKQAAFTMKRSSFHNNNVAGCLLDLMSPVLPLLNGTALSRLVADGAYKVKGDPTEGKAMVGFGMEGCSLVNNTAAELISVKQGALEAVDLWVEGNRGWREGISAHAAALELANATLINNVGSSSGSPVLLHAMQSIGRVGVIASRISGNLGCGLVVVEPYSLVTDAKALGKHMLAKSVLRTLPIKPVDYRERLEQINARISQLIRPSAMYLASTNITNNRFTSPTIDLRNDSMASGTNMRIANVFINSNNVTCGSWNKGCNATFLESGNGGLWVEHSVLQFNTGGSLFMATNATIARFRNVSFASNLLGEQGSAVNVKGAEKGSLEGSTFDGNRVKYLAVMKHVDLVDILNMRVVNTVAIKSVVKVVDCLFGGPVVDTLFSSNAAGNGAVFNLSNVHFRGMSNMSFSNNNATTAILSVSSLRNIRRPPAATFDRCVFIGNLVVGSGYGTAALDVYSRRGVLLTNSRFSDNMARPANCTDVMVGGALSLVGNGSIEVRDSRFYGNLADVGGAIFTNNTNTTITNVTMAGNVASKMGGGIACDSCTQLLLLNSRLRHNTAGAGGAVLFSPRQQLLTEAPVSRFTNVDFLGNGAGWAGGAAQGADNDVVWTVEEEPCPLGGGGAACVRLWAPLRISGCSMVANKATWGGALSINHVGLLETSTPQGNASDPQGPSSEDARRRRLLSTAPPFESACALSMCGTSLTSNRAVNGAGAALFWTNNSHICIDCGESCEQMERASGQAAEWSKWWKPSGCKAWSQSNEAENSYQNSFGVATPPVRLEVLSDADTKAHPTSSVRSGSLITASVNLLDAFGQTVARPPSLVPLTIDGGQDLAVFGHDKITSHQCTQLGHPIATRTRARTYRRNQ